MTAATEVNLTTADEPSDEPAKKRGRKSLQSDLPKTVKKHLLKPTAAVSVS